MNKRGQAVILLGIIAFVISAFIFSFALPLMNALIQNALPDLGSVEGFFIRLLPFAIFFLLVFGLIRLIGGGSQ